MSVRHAALAAVVLGLAMPGAAAAGGAQTHGCPARAPQRLPVPGWAAARAMLAPGGATAAVICRYGGLNAHPRLGLAATAVVARRATVDRITWWLDTLPSGPAGPVACPNDDGSELLVRLRYPGGRLVRITLELTGCSTVTNGAVRRTASGLAGSPGPRLLGLLKRLARPLR